VAMSIEKKINRSKSSIITKIRNSHKFGRTLVGLTTALMLYGFSLALPDGIFAQQVQEKGEKFIGVIDFESIGVITKDGEGFKKEIPEMLISELGDYLNILERRYLAKIIGEQDFTVVMVGKDPYAYIGKLKGVDGLIFGSYSITQENKIRINSRYVDLETPGIEYAKKA